MAYPRRPPPLLKSAFIQPYSAQQRARNLAARHWDLVRAHSPAHLATRHVIDRESTAAAIVGHTGPRAPTDVRPVSGPPAPRPLAIGGVAIPLEPKPPEPDECCMSGCAVCVYDLYLSSLADYKQLLSAAKAQLRARAVPPSEWPDEVRQAKDQHVDDPEDALDSLDPSIKAFLLLEKKLGQKGS